VRNYALETGGATAIEYALCAALMSAAIIAALSSMGGTVNGTLGVIVAALR
jgi:Flp pilus assembly pilin Flp